MTWLSEKSIVTAVLAYTPWSVSLNGILLSNLEMRGQHATPPSISLPKELPSRPLNGNKANTSEQFLCLFSEMSCWGKAYVTFLKVEPRPLYITLSEWMILTIHSWMTVRFFFLFLWCYFFLRMVVNKAHQRRQKTTRGAGNIFYRISATCAC